MLEPPTWGIYVKDMYKDAIMETLNIVPFVNKIASKYDLLWGPFVKFMPDIFIIPKDDVVLSVERRENTIYAKTCISDHSTDAFISLYSDSIDLGCIREHRVKFYDLVPTLMHLLGVPIPYDTDGNILIKTSKPKVKQNYKAKFLIARRTKMIS